MTNYEQSASVATGKSFKMKICAIIISTFCIFFEHLFWKEDQCNEANCTVRRISISERYEKLKKISSYIKYCRGVEDEIWIKVEGNMNWISIAWSASFILLGVVRHCIFQLIHEQENSSTKTNLLWIAALYPVIIHPFFPVTHFRIRLVYVRISDFHRCNLKRKWWTWFASNNLQVGFEAEKSSQE